MSRVVSTSGSLVAYPYTYDSVDRSTYSVANPANAYDAGNSSYCNINLTRGANAYTYVYFLFDTSSIPENAVIDSITCVARVSITNQNTSYIASKGAKMCSGTTEKTASVSVTTTVTNRTFTMGTWTRDEVRDVRIKLYATRAESNTTSNYYLRFYGATLTINYTVNDTYYTVTATSNSSDITVSPAEQEYLEGSDATVSISGDITDAEVKDNNVDVKSQITGSGTSHTYSISNINADHTVAIIVAGVGQTIYYKVNGAWVQASKIWIKQNGTWKEGTMFIKDSGTWKS
jgi:hypothetical protein